LGQRVPDRQAVASAAGILRQAWRHRLHDDRVFLDWRTLHESTGSMGAVGGDAVNLAARLEAHTKVARASAGPQARHRLLEVRAQ
jgi:class 3 adenylate cyclase